MSADQNRGQDPSTRRRPRRGKGLRQLSPRDLWVLPWIASMYVVRFDQLQQLLSREPGQRNQLAPGPQGITDSAVDQVIGRWLESPALVSYDRPHRHRPGWIWLTHYGEQLFDLPYKQHHLRESTFTHKFYVNEVRLDYECRHPDARWVSERDLRCGLPHRKRGEHAGHIPDGEIWLSQDQIVGIEVELSPKDEKEIEKIFSEMLTKYQALWYFVSDLDPVYARAWRVVEKVRSQLPEDLQAKVQIIPLAKVGV